MSSAVAMPATMAVVAIDVVAMVRSVKLDRPLLPFHGTFHARITYYVRTVSQSGFAFDCITLTC